MFSVGILLKKMGIVSHEVKNIISPKVRLSPREVRQKQKLNTTKYGYILNINMLSAILDCSHYPKTQKRQQRQHRDLQ